MIARLRGRLDGVGETWAIVDVGGVGYLVYCSARTLAALPQAGEVVGLEIVTHVREDHIHLYGFADRSERDWFGLLQGVQGVGARVALGVLSVLPPPELLQAVVAQDRPALCRAPSVGPKLAGRIISELKDKVANIALGPAAAAPAAADGLATEAVSALVNLGYRQAEAASAVQAAARALGQEAGLEALIRGSLRELAR